ncbi:NAD(P)/FAD-dependent oxidoreductase [Natronomonas sp. EA1]|uniref:NAD(P)/FAD-dependent oxidoreductase n=1 Tax=Natronomonas sp. EA1 TaxID=3421655 RepID=UPI003EBB501D
MHVAVIGGGAVGTTTAHDLAALGAEVTLFEAGAVAEGSSGRAAGVCYDAFADRLDADLATRALDRFRDRSGEGAFGFEDRPYVWLAREGDTRTVEAIESHVERMRANGLDVSLVSAAELGDRWPALVTDDVACAAVAENAGCADPAAYTELMAARAREAGVTVREQTPARLDGRAVNGDEYDAVVVAAGAHTRRVCEPVAPVPIKPYRVQALVTESVDIETPQLYDASGGYYLRPRAGGLLVGDGTEPVERDPDDWEREADGWFLEACEGYERRALARSFSVERAWAGLCTATPDGNPLFGELTEGVFVAAGWQGHGFMRAPAFSEILANRVVSGIDHEALHAFSPTRFDGDEDFEIVEGMARNVEG